MQEQPSTKKQKIEKDFFGALKGIGKMTKEDEYDICPNLEKRFFKEK